MDELKSVILKAGTKYQLHNTLKEAPKDIELC
jgi:hypothetical protein